MSGHHTSDDEDVVDDGLNIKPPQLHHHRHKDRKRDRGESDRHRNTQKSSRNLQSGDIERRQERRHHRDRDDQGRHQGGGDRERERGSSSSSSKQRSSVISTAPFRKQQHQRNDRASGSSGSRDLLLFEVKKERRNIELENERALREIERRREKEKGASDELLGEESGSGSSRHRREKRSHRDKSERDRDRNRPPPIVPSTPPEEIERREREARLAKERIHLEVQEIEESSGSDLEEGERSRSEHSKEEQQGHGDASDVSSALDDEDNSGIIQEEEKQRGDISSSSAASSHKNKSHSDAKSDDDDDDSSSSSSSSDQQSDAEDDEAENGIKPSKIPRKNSPPQTPQPHSSSSPKTTTTIMVEKNPSSGGDIEDNNKVTTPSIVVTLLDEPEEEDLLPPYYPALQGCRRVEEFQLLNRIEEGTYGVVYRAKEKRTDEIVALKRLKMEKEKDGFPITSLREINTLLKAQHENIVTVREIVVGSNTDKIFLVMDYVEHDLKALMETLKLKGQVFLPEEVKCLMIQLLRAVAHMHDNWILHRDLKTSNLLLSHKGILKVGDFGLAREYGSPLKAYTPIVVTLWYRAPELLLGTKEYSTPIDVWSVGCIFGELLKMEPMFPGKSEANQLNLIFQSLGTPNDRIWPGYSQLPLLHRMTFADYPVNKLKTRFGHLTDQGIDMMNKFLTFNPAKRLTAEDALSHPFFKEMPVAIDPSMFPTWPAKSELGHRKKEKSPPPPSGGHQFQNDEDAAGFFLGGGDARKQPLGAGFSLRF